MLPAKFYSLGYYFYKEYKAGEKKKRWGIIKTALAITGFVPIVLVGI